jgi:NAD-dependent SIR2 family protein deacetylase
MASTALKDSEIHEYFDSNEDVRKNVKKLINLLKSSQHAVIYTGAGISTSAGISDFRGPTGVWTLRAKGLPYKPKYHVKMPTLAHMAIKKLIDENIVKYLVSQNTDGLHIKSGVPHSKIAELHGNTNKEYCPKCKKVYFRDYHTRNARDVHNHKTGRMCNQCGTELWDSIINFQESLPEEELRNAQKESKLCDLAIVLGTSMRVSPACHLPLMRKSGGKLVICNLQKTPYDDQADILIHCETDRIMLLLMQELEIDIPDYVHEFQFRVTIEKKYLTISNVSTNLFELLNRLVIVDKNNNEYTMIPGRKLNVNLVEYKEGQEILMKFDFNILNEFSGEVRVVPPCVVVIQINTCKNTMFFKTF